MGHADVGSRLKSAISLVCVLCTLVPVEPEGGDGYISQHCCCHYNMFLIVVMAILPYHVTQA